MERITHLNSLICPICKTSLSKWDKSFRCENNHSFDIAKEGYVNLLPVNKKNSLNPGDNSEMIVARRSFLEKGFYQLLSDKISSVIEELDIETALDVCCGEGYYTDRVFGKSTKTLAFDISKFAVKYAAKKHKNQFYFVGSVFDIPVKPNSQDLVLSVFTPISNEEFYRVLSDSGSVIIVSAHEDHMKEVAEMIYGTFKPHTYHPKDKLCPAFEIVKDERLKYSISLDNNASIINMLKMTPYYWSVDEAQKVKFDALESLEVTCDFRISVFKKG